MTSSWAECWQHVWVVGGSTGIGAELVRQLADAGVQVTVSARSAEKLDALAKELATVTALPLDVTDADACAEAVSGFATVPDLVIFNAAIYSPMDVANYSAEKAREMMRVNYEGVINPLDPVMKAMVARGAGHIAIVASVSGYFGLPMAAGYSPSKAALHNLAESLYPGLKKAGVAISIVNPGFVKTRLTERNKFAMPQLLEVEDAVRRILRGLERRRFEVIFPRPFAPMIKWLRNLPRSWVFAYTKKLV